MSQIRRQAKERREYLYRKALELQEAATVQKRQIIKKSLESGRALPKDLKNDSAVKDFAYDQSELAEELGIDDEYARLSGIADPNIVVTTSRDPSTRLAQFTKEIKLLFPTAVRLNRGNYVMSDLVSACTRGNSTDIIVLHEHRGTPTSLTVSHLPYGPTARFSLHNVVLRHDIVNAGTVSEVYPHVIFEGFTTDLGKRVVTILKHLFPPGAKKDSSRVVTFANQGDFISMRHHVYARTNDGGVELAEVGPRFEMKLYEITLGTVDDKDAQVEWHARRFVRTANKKDYL